MKNLPSNLKKLEFDLTYTGFRKNNENLDWIEEAMKYVRNHLINLTLDLKDNNIKGRVENFKMLVYGKIKSKNFVEFYINIKKQ